MHTVTQRLKRCAVAVAVMLAASTPAIADDLSLLPVDAEFVGGLDLQALQNSALWKSVAAPMIAKNGMQKEIAEFQAQCGVDPQKVVTKVTFGLKAGAGGDPDGVVVMHGMSKTKAVACYDKLVKSGKIGSNLKRDGDILLITNNGRTGALSFSNETTAVLVFGANGTKDGIKNVLKGGSALKSSAAFSELYKKTNTGDTLWMIANGSSKVFDGVAALGFKPRAVFGSLTVTKDLNLDMRMRMKTAGEATNLQSFLSQQSKPAQGMVDKLAITTDDKDVRVVVGISEAKLKQLAAMMGGMLGGGRP
jgi:hypothetical protein